MDQNENKNYNLENDPGQTQPGSAGAERKRPHPTARRNRVYVAA